MASHRSQSAFWHPFSSISRANAERVVFVSGRGSTLVDDEGREYLDATAALWYALVGHGRAEIAGAMAEQASRLAACSCFDVYASDRTLELADRLAALVPLDDASVFFTSGGSDSIETALKVTRRYFAAVGRPEKRVVIHRESAYHGMHAFGTSVAGIAANRDGFGGLVGETEMIDAFDASVLAQTIDRLGSDRVAAFIAEPVIGAGGVHPPPRGYLEEVERICRLNDVLLVVDEVITGLGRTGAWFASERYGIRPDIMVLAKGLTSGYLPLGATVFSGRVVAPFAAEDGPFLRHGYTYSGHATACAAALANLDVLQREDLPGRVAAMEGSFARRMRTLADLEAVSEVRTVGLTAAVQLAGELNDSAAAMAVADRCRDRGVITRTLAGNALHVSPPFVVTGDEIGRIIDVIGTTLEHCAGAPS